MISRIMRILPPAVAMVFLVPATMAAAPLQGVPDTWTQPDGTVVFTTATGDEFHRNVSDDRGFTVLRDFDSGWLMYADVVDDRLVPTILAAGLDDPVAAGLRPGLRMSRTQYDATVMGRRSLRVTRAQAPSTGTINNLFVFIRFADDDILLEETAGYERQFNSTADGDPSMRAYFREVSRNAVDVVTTFTPAPDGKWMTAWTSRNNRRYYQPYDAVHNPTGYTSDGELEVREHQMLKEALAEIEPGIPDAIDFDANDDGYFDNVIFMVQGWPDTWSDLLWPHQWEFYDTVKVKGLTVGTYNLQLSVLMLLSPGTFVHEMYHSFGAPDLYHYSLDEIEPVGPWDVMETTGINTAQHPLAYMKWQYGGWIDDIPVVEQNQEVILTADWNAGTQAVRVAVPESGSEYFVMEYRLAEGMFESSLPGSGLIVYRIDPSIAGDGNRNGPPDEVYVFRPGGSPTANGEVDEAAMGAGGRTVMNDWTDPRPTLADGTPVTLRVYDVKTAGSNISFKVCLQPPGCGEKVCGDDGCGGWCGDCAAGNRCEGGACVLCSCDGRECDDDGCGVSCGECDDENQCTVDSCGDWTCTFTIDDGGSCDDGNPCTSGDVCDAEGECAGIAYTCALSSCVESVACDGAGGCNHVNQPEGTGCVEDGIQGEGRCDGTGVCVAVIPEYPPETVTTDLVDIRVEGVDTAASDDIEDAATTVDIFDTSEPGEIGTGGCSAGQRTRAACPALLLLVFIAALAARRRITTR